MVIVRIVITLVILSVASNTFALERFDIITTEKMQALLEQRKAAKIDFVLVNSLDEMIYRNSHIPGSVNIPLSSIDENIHKLGQDLSKLIIPY